MNLFLFFFTDASTLGALASWFIISFLRLSAATIIIQAVVFVFAITVLLDMDKAFKAISITHLEFMIHSLLVVVCGAMPVVIRQTASIRRWPIKVIHRIHFIERSIGSPELVEEQHRPSVGDLDTVTSAIMNRSRNSTACRCISPTGLCRDNTAATKILVVAIRQGQGKCGLVASIVFCTEPHVGDIFGG